MEFIKYRILNEVMSFIRFFTRNIREVRCSIKIHLLRKPLLSDFFIIVTISPFYEWMKSKKYCQAPIAEMSHYSELTLEK